MKFDIFCKKKHDNKVWQFRWIDEPQERQSSSLERSVLIFQATANACVLRGDSDLIKVITSGMNLHHRYHLKMELRDNLFRRLGNSSLSKGSVSELQTTEVLRKWNWLNHVRKSSWDEGKHLFHDLHTKKEDESILNDPESYFQQIFM